MIRRLTIKNFQLWEYLEIEFDEYITTLVGPSDTGKSAILRALGLACFNVPSGTSYIRHNTDGTEIHLTITDESIPTNNEWKITRLRSDSNNSYELGGAVFRAFGTDVPEEIRKILNLDEAINFQSQLDGPYWFNETPGQISKNLNQIVALSEIDDALTDVSSRLTQARTNLKLVKDRKDKASAKVVELEWVPGLVEDLTLLAEREQQRNALQFKIESITIKLTYAKESQVEVERMESLVRSLEGQVSIVETRDRIRSQISSIASTIQRLRNLQQSLDKSSPIDTSTSEHLRAQYTDCFEQRSRLEGIVKKGKELKGELCRLNQSLREIEEQLQTISGGRCPLCGSTMDRQHAH